MANFTSREEGIEAGLPEALEGNPLGLREMNAISRLADFLLSRDTRRTPAGTLKQALRLYAKTHEFVRGEWRESNSVRLGGRDPIDIEVRTGFLD